MCHPDVGTISQITNALRFLDDDAYHLAIRFLDRFACFTSIFCGDMIKCPNQLIGCSKRSQSSVYRIDSFITSKKTLFAQKKDSRMLSNILLPTCQIFSCLFT